MSTLDQQVHDRQQQLNAAVDAQAAKVEAAWAQAWTVLEREWEAAVQEILNARVDGRWPTRRQIFHLQRVAHALQLTTEQLDRLSRQLGVDIRPALSELVTTATRTTQALLAVQLPSALLHQLVRVDNSALEEIIRRSAHRITALSRPLPGYVEQEIKAVLIRGIAVGDNPLAAAKQMQDRLLMRWNLGRDRADNIARTEMLDAHRAATQRFMQANSDMVTGWSWYCAQDERTCRACLSMQGSEHPVDDPGPLGHPRCRCTAIPITASWAELGIDLPDNRPGIETGEDWLAKQPEQVQDEILTKAGADAWRRGEWPASQWAHRKATTGWRDAYYSAPPPKTPGGPRA